MPNLTPSFHFVDIIKQLKSHLRPIRVAELGVDTGATTKAVASLLDNMDTYDLFDMLDCPLFNNLDTLFARCQINVYGNSRLLHDSYAWSLANLYRDLRISGPTEIYDAIYLDGAHTFPVDAPAACIAKELLKPNGYLILDDLDWTLATSPTCNTPSMRSKFTEEQMTASHVRLIAEIFFDSDCRFTRTDRGNLHRAVYQKLQNQF
jgi:hypothetical protein